jgi:hypothetical protein
MEDGSPDKEKPALGAVTFGSGMSAGATMMKWNGEETRHVHGRAFSL